MRRLLLVNALIFAVLAAAVALAYYGYSYTTSENSLEREKRLMNDLAEEKVLNIEAILVAADQRLFTSPLPLQEFVAKLRDLAADVHVVSVFVLDSQLEVIPDGYVGPPRRGAKEAAAFRDWFKATVVPTLPLRQAEVGVRGHVHAYWSGWPRPGDRKDFLFSFVKKIYDDKTYYIVIEEDLGNLVGFLFYQYFPPFDRSKRIYQVIETSNGSNELVCCSLFGPEKGAPHVEVPFVDTVDMWSVRVSETDESARKELQRKRLIDSLFIGGAMTVMLAGLLVLVLAIRRERRANELKSEFISNVSHELKTPLSIISMFGEMLANGRTKGPDQATEYADIIWRESVRLSRLIDNVLDFAKIERGKNVYEFAEADIADVVERAVDLVGRRLTTADMTIDVEIEPELPPVQLDANAFTLAVMNLIDNATKYAADGKRIELELRREGERIVLTVRDYGPGIDAAELDQIFERFYRARAVRLKPIRGSGIGLALVRHIARAHHGDVTVESAPGKGSTFRLWIPISQ